MRTVPSETFQRSRIESSTLLTKKLTFIHLSRTRPRDQRGRMILIVIPGFRPLLSELLMIIAEDTHWRHRKHSSNSRTTLLHLNEYHPQSWSLERGSERARFGEEWSSGIEVWCRSITAMAIHSSISYVSGNQLQGLQGPNIAVVDVRDDERAFDGHIAGSMHFSSGSFEEKLPKLVEEVKNKDTVVFHCSFSQVRGPTCARILNEHLNAAVAEGKLEKVPNIVVLERGFNGWAESGRPVCSCQDLVCTHTA